MDNTSRKHRLSEQSSTRIVERLNKGPHISSHAGVDSLHRPNAPGTQTEFHGQGIQHSGQGNFHVQGDLSIMTNAIPTSNDVALRCQRDLFSTDPFEDRMQLKRKGDRARGTCEWIRDTKHLSAWLDSGYTTEDSQTDSILWLHGNPGTGKSTMAIFLTEELSASFDRTDGKTLAYFFCDSSSNKRNTATSIIRGLLYQLIQQHPQLLQYILPAYNMRLGKLFESFEALWTILMDATADQDTGRKYFIIDALDECDVESQKSLLEQLSETFQREDAPSNVRILITSRPYSEIREYLEDFANQDLASFPGAKDDIDQCITERIEGIAKRKSYTGVVKERVSNILREKANGTFLWVGLACKELESIPSKDAIQFLNNMPKGLQSLYAKLLKTATEGESSDHEIQRILNCVAVCLRPLSVLELSEACKLFTGERDIETRVQYTRDQIASCRLMVIIRDDKVLLLHQSVKDFLSSAEAHHFINDLKAHANLAYCCIDTLIKDSCDIRQSKTHLLDYAIMSWVHHARMAKSSFQIEESQMEFFSLVSPSREHWLRLYRRDERNDRIGRKFSILHVTAKWGITALANHLLSEAKTEEMARLIDCMDTSGATPLDHAAESGHVCIIGVLQELGGRLRSKTIQIAAGNRQNGKEVMEELLVRWGDELPITEGVMKAAARNHQSGKELMALLLDRLGDKLPITEAVVEAAARNNQSSKEIMALLLDRLGDKLPITEGVVEAAAGNYQSGKEIMALLLNRLEGELPITEAVMEAAARNDQSGKELMALLLDRLGDKVSITRKMVHEIAERFDGKTMTLLLDRLGDKLRITEAVVEAAARNHQSGKEVMALLLDSRRGKAPTSEETISFIAQNFDGDMMILLLGRLTVNILATEKMVQLVAEGFDEEVMELLLNRLGDELPITEGVVEAAARNHQSGKELMALLLDRWGDELPITEAVVEAAARNNQSGKEVMALLLDRLGDELPITEHVVEAAAGNYWSGKEVMALLLDRLEGKLPITEGVVEAAVRNYRPGKEVMTLLLDRLGDKLGITEGVVEAAARNYQSGKEVMALLLDRWGDELPITEGVVKAAAGNYRSGKEVMALLLDRLRVELPITEAVMEAAAGNVEMIALLNRRKNYIAILKLYQRNCQLFNAARNGDTICLERLLSEGAKPDITNNKRETPLWIAAAAGQAEVVQILASRNDVDVNWRSISGESPLFTPCCQGNEAIVHILMKFGANASLADKNGDTALTKAERNGHDEVVKIILESAS